MIDAVIRHAVLGRGEQAELTLESQDVPRINRAAFDTAMQKVFDLRQQLDGLLQVAQLNGQVPGRNSALDLAHDPSRSDGHDMRTSG